MPEVVIGWCAHCWAGIGDGIFDIWEGIIYYIPIWDVSVPQGERGGAGEHLATRPRSPGFQIRKVVPVVLARARFCSWARWGWFFIEKNMYMSRYNLFTYNILFYKSPGT